MVTAERSLADRQQAQVQAQDNKLAAGLVQGYGDVWKALQPQVDAMAQKIGDAVANGEDVSPAWLLRQERLKSLLQQTQAQLDKYGAHVQGQVEASQRSATEMAVEHFGEHLPVGIDYNRLPTEAIEKMVGITQDDGEPLHKALERYSSEGADTIKRKLIAGLGMGNNPDKIARDMKKALGGPLSNYMRLARTETARAYTEASLASYRDNAHLLSGWTWITAEDERVCDFCGPLDGQVFDLEDPFDTHPNCRCCTAPVVAGLGGQAQASTQEQAQAEDVPQEQADMAEPAESLAAADPLVHANAKEAIAWAKENWQKPKAMGMSKDEVYALDTYSGPAYKFINRYLRDGTLPAAIPQAQMDTFIANLDNALTRQTVPEDVRVVRGMSLKAFGGMSPADAVGATFTESGYMSTSVGNTVHDNFAAAPMHFQMNVPAGTPAYYLANISQTPGERELMLGRDLNYTVRSATYDEQNGRWNVVADVLPGGK